MLFIIVFSIFSHSQEYYKYFHILTHIIHFYDYYFFLFSISIIIFDAFIVLIFNSIFLIPLFINLFISKLDLFIFYDYLFYPLNFHISIILHIIFFHSYHIYLYIFDFIPFNELVVNLLIFFIITIFFLIHFSKLNLIFLKDHVLLLNFYSCFYHFPTNVISVSFHLI